MFPNRTYSIEETLSVYDEMLVQMRQKIKQHRNVVLDATFHQNGIRRKFFEGAEEVDRFICIEVRAEESLIKERLKRSREDSEADFDVYKKIKNKWQPLYDDHLILHSTDDNLNAMLEKTAADLQLMNDKRTNK
jgi:predicted kinase